MISSLILMTALVVGEYDVQVHKDEFTQKRQLIAIVDASQITKRQGEPTGIGVGFVTPLPSRQDPSISIKFDGFFLIPSNYEVIFRIDEGEGGQFGAECEWNPQRAILRCEGSTRALINALKTAKDRVRVRTALADFSLPVQDLKAALARFDELVTANNPAKTANARASPIIP